MTTKPSRRKVTFTSNIPFEKIAKFSEKDWGRFENECKRLSRNFYNNIVPFLQYDPAWELTLEKPVFYRVINPLFSPCSPSGSLADGARMNVGGAQSSRFALKTYGTLAKKQGAIYFASSWKTAIWEAFGGDASFNYAVKQVKSHKHKDIYRFQLKNATEPLTVIDFEKAYKALTPTFRLNTFFSITAQMNGIWGDLKVPAPIQLFAAWLIEKSEANAHCIQFPSTADPSTKGLNFAFYIRDDVDAHNTFDFAPYTIP